MENFQNLLEYYDELFPVSQQQKDFYKELISEYASPVKLLNVNCGTGLFDNYLSKEGCDVTGTESSKYFIRSANLRKRNQLMSVRFFQMGYDEIGKFLTKGFYNIISCLNNRSVFISSKDKLEKFLSDCKNLICENGKLVINLVNPAVFGNDKMIQLPVRESIRVKLFTELWTAENGKRSIVGNIETGNGKMLPVIINEPVYLPQLSEVEAMVKAAGFKSIKYYADFDKSEFTGKEQDLICIIS